MSDPVTPAYPPGDARWPHNQPGYRLFVNDDSTVLVRIWANGDVEVCTREHRSHTWGPPVFVTEEDA